MSWTPEAPQLLDVEVQQVTGMGVDVTIHRSYGLEHGQAIETGMLQDAANGAGRKAEPLADGAIGVSLAPQGDRPLPFGLGGLVGAAVRARSAVGQAGYTFLAETRQPLVSCSHAHPGRLGRLHRSQAVLDHASDQQGRS